MSTIREHLETIRDRHLRPTNMPDNPWCNHCDRPWPCPDNLTAIHALTLLDESPGIANGASATVDDPTRLVRDRGWHPSHEAAGGVGVE